MDAYYALTVLHLLAISAYKVYRYISSGEVSEWLNEPVSKTGVPVYGTAGSNPALSVVLLTWG